MTLSSPSQWPAGLPGRRRALARLLAVCLGLGVGLLVSEVAVRLVIGSPLPERLPLLQVRAHPSRGWEMLPSVPHYTYHHRVTVNALGLRGPEIREKRDDEVRILALGDSLVYGQGVADDQTAPFHMERTLNARSGDDRAWQQASEAVGASARDLVFTVVNGGVRGYATHQEIALLSELGPTIDPDVIVLFWYWNDLIEQPVVHANAALTTRGPLFFDTNSTLEGWDRTAWRLRGMLRRSALLMWLHDVFSSADSSDLPVSQTGPALERLDGYFERLTSLAGSLEATAVVAILPDPMSLRGPHASDVYRAQVTELATLHGLPVIDLLPAAQRADRGGIALPVVPFDGHFNEAANEMLGRAAAEFALEAFVSAAHAAGGTCSTSPGC